MTWDGAQATAARGGRIQILHVSGELDLATADGLAARGCDVFAHAGLLLLDLSDLSFCDACGLSAFVRIANYADMRAGRCVLIAPQPQVVKLLRICRLNQRLSVFATVDDALANLTATAAPARANQTQLSAKAGQVPMPTRRRRPGRHARSARLLAAERAADATGLVLSGSRHTGPRVRAVATLTRGHGLGWLAAPGAAPDWLSLSGSDVRQDRTGCT